MRILRNNSNQIRSGWKIGILYLSFLITTVIVSGIFSSLYSVIILANNPELRIDKVEYENFFNEQFSSMAHFSGISLYLIQCITMILCVIMFWKIWDKRKMSDIGFISIKNSWKDLCLGLLIGAISFTIVAVMLLLTNFCRTSK